MGSEMCIRDSVDSDTYGLSEGSENHRRRLSCKYVASLCEWVDYRFLESQSGHIHLV